MSFVKNDVATLWAMTSTGVALILLGVLLGKSLDSTTHQTPLASSTEPGAPLPIDNYQVPDWLIDLPMEWRSDIDTQPSGVALRLDPQRRELLIDECQHLGFFDKQRNLPRERGGLTCERILTGTLLAFTDNEVLLRTRQGNEQVVGLRLIHLKDVSLLEVTLDGTSVELVPGQTNDLNRDIEQLPTLLEEQQLLGQFKLQVEKQQRALVAKLDANHIPRFSIPASVMQEHDAIRRADMQRDELTKHNAD